MTAQAPCSFGTIGRPISTGISPRLGPGSHEAAARTQAMTAIIFRAAGTRGLLLLTQRSDIMDQAPAHVFLEGPPAGHHPAPLRDLPVQFPVGLALDRLVREVLWFGVEGRCRRAITPAGRAVAEDTIRLVRGLGVLDSCGLGHGVLHGFCRARRFPLLGGRHADCKQQDGDSSNPTPHRRPPLAPTPTPPSHGTNNSRQDLPALARLEARRATRRPTFTPWRRALASMVARRTTSRPLDTTAGAISSTSANRPFIWSRKACPALTARSNPSRAARPAARTPSASRSTSASICPSLTC